MVDMPHHLRLIIYSFCYLPKKIHINGRGLQCQNVSRTKEQEKIEKPERSDIYDINTILNVTANI